METTALLQLQTLPALDLQQKMGEDSQFTQAVIQGIRKTFFDGATVTDLYWIKKAIHLFPSNPTVDKLVQCITNFLNKFAFMFDGRVRGPVIDMIDLGEMKCAQQFLEKGKGMNEVGALRGTALHRIIYRKDIESLRMLFPYVRLQIEALNIERQTPLHFAIENEFWEGALFLIENGADINKADIDGNTPLHIAIMKGNKELALLLLEKSVYSQNGKGQSPLYLVIKMELDDVAFAIIKSGKELTEKNRGGFQPLHNALWYKREEVAMALVEKGVPLNARTYDNTTPLEIALEKNLSRMAELLLDKGADPSLKGSDETTALHWVQDVALCRRLLDCGLKIDAGNMRQNTPLFLSLRNKHFGVAELLLDRGAQVNVGGDMFNITPLYIAVVRGAPRALIEKLLDAGARVDQRRRPEFFQAIEKRDWEKIGSMKEEFPNLQYPEHLHPSRRTKGPQRWYLPPRSIEIDSVQPADFYRAVTKRNIARVREIMQTEKINLNRFIEQSTPLMDAVEVRDRDMVAFFLSEGADPNLLVRDRSCLYSAVSRKDIEIATLLLTHKANPNVGGRVLAEAVLNDDFEMVQLLVSFGVEITIEALCTALQYARKGIVLFLIEKIKNVNGEESTDGDTPLHVAKDRFIMKKLLDKGAKINATDRLGKTALCHHVEYNHIEAALFLLERDASCSKADEKGNIPLHYVRSKQVCEMLLNKRPQLINTKNRLKLTPLDAAEINQNLAIVSILKEHGAR